MMKLYMSLMSLFAYEHSSSFLSASSGVTGTISLFFSFIGRQIVNGFKIAMSWLKELSWTIIKFVLGVVDAFEYMINSFLGIDTSVQDMVDYAKDVDSVNFLQVLTKTFRALVAIAIVLLIVFTIIAIIRQEYNNALQNGAQGNEKGPIILGLFKKMLYIVLLPLTMIFILTGVNSILTAFSRAMKGKNNMTIASQILATSTYDSNKYRYYAQQNKRIPIVIRTYDPDDYEADENDLLIQKIQSVQVQESLRTTAVNISSNNLLTFKESLTYKNNKLTNSIEYGDIYEKFICTPEQYQVMAEFIDYAQQTNMNFQIRPIDDVSVDWAYVDTAVFNPNDVSLKITYRDASDLDDDGKTDDTYTIEYSSSFNVTSPINDSLKSIMALLGIDDYSDNLYKTMERDENYVNLVNWANEKVLIKLSGTVDNSGNKVPFKLNDPSTWSRIDQLIMYEYYHFSSNNTFGNYSIDDMIKGVELDAAQICYRKYYPDAGAYSPEKIIDCVEINNSYYHIEKDPYQTDEYGNVYYVLKDALNANESGSFLNNNYSVIEKIENNLATLKLSSTFDLNDTTSWSYSDQVLIYEFYKDLTYNNDLYIYNFSDFEGESVKLPVYEITHKQLKEITGASSGTSSDEDNGVYVLINGTYYEVEETSEGSGEWALVNPGTESTSLTFLNEATEYRDTYYYNYALSLNDEYSVIEYGISTDETALITADKLVLTTDKFVVEGEDVEHYHANFTAIEQNDPNFENYTDFNIQFSKKFNYADVDTWTYKDYFLFYLYAKYPNITGSAGIESLRISGLSGNIGTISTFGPDKYVFQVKYGTCTSAGCTKDLYFYIDIDNTRNVSGLIINKELDTSVTMAKNFVDRENNLFVQVERDKLLTADSEVFVFKFSEKFEESFPNNWTVLDYILYMFSTEGRISSLENLQENGYSSVKYTTNDGGVYYQFGKSEDNTFLSLNGIKSLVDCEGNLMNFQKENDFLNLDLVDYIAKYYKTSQNSIITDKDGIIDVLYRDLSEYLYDTDAIIEKIIEENAFNLDGVNKINVLDYISEYTYSSAAKINDLSTWSHMDALIFALTGNLKSSVTSYIIEYNEKKYFVIGDKAIDVSSETFAGGETNPFKANLSDVNTVTSLNTSYSAGSGSVLTYVNTNYIDKIVSASEIANKSITKYSSSKFSYKRSNSTYTVFDLIYEYIKGTAINNGETLLFDAYSDGNEIYLKINADKYVKVTDDFNNEISISRKSTLKLANSESIATKLDAYTYTAFDNAIDENSSNLDLTSLMYTKLDAIIYSLTGSSTTTTYSVYEYKADGKKYIYVAGKYLLVDDSASGTSAVINNSNFENISIQSNNSINDEVVNNLYNSHYAGYYTTTLGSVLAEESTDVVFEYSKANLSDNVKITELSPLALIFSKLGLINIKSAETEEVRGTIVTTQRGEKYFYYYDTVNGTDYKFYLNITKIAHTYIKDQESGTTYLVDNAYSKYEMILKYLLLNNGVSESEYVDNYLKLLSEIKTNYSSKTVSSNLNTVLTNVSSFAYTNPASWTLFNILYNNLTGERTINGAQIVYLDNDGNKYVKVSASTRELFVQVSGADYIFTKFTTTNSSFDREGESGLDPLGIIASMLTGRDSATEDPDVKYVTIPDTIISTTSNFYLIRSADGAYHAVYGLDGTAEAIKSAVSVGNYTYLYEGVDNIAEWSVFDIILADVYDNISYKELISKLYIFGSEAYILIDNDYINVTKIGLFDNDMVEDILTNVIGTANDIDKNISDITPTFRELFFATTAAVGKNAFVIDSSIISASEPEVVDDEPEDPETPVDELSRIYFSENFDVNDYSTWTLSDLIIYYMFTEHPDYFVGETAAIKTITNFQELVKQGYVPAHEYNYVVTDDFGNTTIKKVLWFGVNATGNGIALNKEAFQKYYGEQVSVVEYLDVADKLTMNLGSTANGGAASATLPEQTLSRFYLARNIALNSNDFIYNNYYYFKINFDYLDALRSTNFATVANGTAKADASINIKLREGFFTEDAKNSLINTPGEWTWLEFIVIYEFSNTAVRHNFFEGMSFEELATDNYLPLFSVGDELILEINGNYYNLNRLSYTDDGVEGISQSDINSIKSINAKLKLSETNLVTVDKYVSKGEDGSSQMKTLFAQYEYFVKKDNDYTLDYSKTPESILFSVYDTIYFMELDTNLVMNYSINVASLECNNNYTLTNIVREVNWPQKLMNDMQTLYPELNWSTLIATDSWIDTLGNFTSAHATGEYKSEGNSANITAAGLVLSEFFLSVTREQEDYTSVHEYEYEPVFDEDTIKSLMLAMLGEEEYNDLSMQAGVFIDLFNDMFIPILEDIAAERGIQIVDGKIDNFYISVYKAYMATVLLSSDMGEYFYKIATRVYAQYTIYDSLASASGDYAAYLDYINGELNQDGEEVTAFRYSSFHELVIYENSFKGNVNPTFTFNLLSVVKYFYGKNITYKGLSNNYTFAGTAVSGLASSEEKVTSENINKLFENEGNFKKLLNLLNAEYNKVYLNYGSRISDSNDTGIYCFMFDVYWSIKQEISKKNQDNPIYLKNYYAYLMGDIKRWVNVADNDITGSSATIPDQPINEISLKIYMTEVVGKAVKIYMPDVESVNLDELSSNTDTSSVQSFFSSLFGELDDQTISTSRVLQETFMSGQYSVYRQAYKDLFGDPLNNTIGLFNTMTSSENGNVDSWKKILKIRDDLELLISELTIVSNQSAGTFVDGDKTRGYRSSEEKYTDEKYTKAISDLKNYKEKIDDYISAQELVDTAIKTSITFTLAQFGKNYITEGFSFQFENKSYTLKSTTSPERLAEYVYGGAFLDKFGVPATYTNSEYNGFIQSYKSYDSSLDRIITNLSIWSELRTFVSELANYTAKLYYLSNMNDLSENVGDSILLTDIVYEGSSTTVEKSLEYIILEYLISSDISADTLLRLMFGDSVATLDGLVENGANINETDLINFYAIANYLEGSYVVTDTDDNGVIEVNFNIGGTPYTRELTSVYKRDVLKKYLSFIMLDGAAGYNSYGYYNEGSNKGTDRIHTIFKKVISYLVVTEESGESVAENTINLDNINFKKFRQILIKALSDYQKNPSETDIENTNRYITLFNLICSQFEYTYYSTVTNEDGSITSKVITAGTSISSLYLAKNNDGKIYYGSVSDSTALHAEFSIDVPTRDIILTLAGVENRPIEELVGLEYDTLYGSDGQYDEADGDTFVVCTYNEIEGKYYPVIARNKNTNISISSNAYKYILNFGVDFTTKYYDTNYCYPIVAKGIIDAAGQPTAIRMVDNSIIFYRTSITATTKVGESAIYYAKNTGDVTTVGYTKYVAQSFSAAGGREQRAMFTGASNIDQFLNTDFLVYFIQFEEAYGITDKDNFDSISVLDQFAAFYNLEIRQYALFILGFTTIIPMLFKASGAVLHRILDLILLVLMGPIAISTTAISPDKNGQTTGTIFDTWKDYLTKTLLHVFGYIIAFNIYYILTTTVMNMDIVTDSTMNVIYKVGGLSSIITKDGANAFMRLLLMLCAASALETSADLLVKIVTAGKADSAFTTPMASDTMASIKEMATKLKQQMDKAKSFITGEIIFEAKDFALESAKRMIPGSSVVRGAVHMGQNLHSKKKGKELEEAAIANGISPGAAKKMAKKYADTEIKNRETKRENQRKNANKFMKNAVGMDGDMFSKTSKFTSPSQDKAAKEKKKKEEKEKKKGKKGKKSDKKKDDKKKDDK